MKAYAVLDNLKLISLRLLKILQVGDVVNVKDATYGGAWFRGTIAKIVKNEDCKSFGRPHDEYVYVVSFWKE